MSELVEINPEYIYVTIPAEYICVYHKILGMMADYGEDMIKDCKASCTDKSREAIDCFNMFNSAVAARKLGKMSLANTLIKYVKEKINMIYKCQTPETSFVFPVDENGELKAFVSCGEQSRFEINPEDMELYEHKFGLGFPQHFQLDHTDNSYDGSQMLDHRLLETIFFPFYEQTNGLVRACCEIIVAYNDILVDPNEYTVDYYIDDTQVDSFHSLIDPQHGETHTFKAVIKYKNLVHVKTQTITYEDPNN